MPSKVEKDLDTRVSIITDSNSGTLSQLHLHVFRAQSSLGTAERTSWGFSGRLGSNSRTSQNPPKSRRLCLAVCMLIATSNIAIYCEFVDRSDRRVKGKVVIITGEYLYRLLTFTLSESSIAYISILQAPTPPWASAGLVPISLPIMALVRSTCVISVSSISHHSSASFTHCTPMSRFMCSSSMPRMRQL